MNPHRVLCVFQLLALSGLPLLGQAADLAQDAQRVDAAESATDAVADAVADAIADATPGSIEQILAEAAPDQSVATEYDYLRQRIEAAETAPVKALMTARVRRIEDTHDRYHPDLVEPLTVLGEAELAEGDFTSALDNFSRAVHISRVSHGLFSAAQVPVVYKEADAHVLQQDLAAATEREEYAFEVLQKAHGPYSEAMLPGVMRIARWYRNLGDVFQARRVYQRALLILDKADRYDLEEAIPALRGLADTYRLERYPPVYLDDDDRDEISSSMLTGRREVIRSTDGLVEPIRINNFPAGEEALQQVVRIYQQDPEANRAELDAALLDLGDWNLLFGQADDARQIYALVYERQLAAGEDPDTRFAQPVLLHFPRPQDPRAPRGTSPGEPAAGHVTLKFNVSEYGQVRNLETVEAVPSSMEFRVRRSMRDARFRPRLVAGVPSEADYAYVHEFQYYPKEDATPDAEDPTDGQPGPTDTAGTPEDSQPQSDGLNTELQTTANPDAN